MRYHLSFDDKTYKAVDMWRGDCEKNPDSPQDGTWKFSRNGWCPGSVEPGLFLDVTDYLPRTSGKHRAALDATVLNQETQEYEPYTNYGQGSGGDDAHIFVGLSLMVYDSQAVEAIRSQPHAYTAAELALREGISNAAAEVPLKSAKWISETPAESSALIQANHFEDVKAELSADMRFNFEQQAPWYNVSKTLFQRAGNQAEDVMEESYDEDFDGFDGENGYVARDKRKIQSPAGVAEASFVEGARSETSTLRRIAAFGDSGVLIQAGPTHLRQAVLDAKELPETWGQVGLQLKLSQPPGMAFDFWDRIGSVGLFLPPQNRWSADVTQSKGAPVDISRKEAGRGLQLRALSAK